MTKYKRYTITSALPYANGPIHIGHLAGVYIPADIYARYLRSINQEVLFIGGSDEHGVPITIKAKNENITPQQVVDKYHNIIKKSFDEFGISFDIYSRTSLPVHHETASEFFKTLFDKGCFIEKSTEQFYDEENKQFLADRYITGTCPNCKYERAYGDQCENCGSTLNATDLINPKSAISGNTPLLKETKHWFLPLEQYENWLKKWILEEHKDDWKINVYGQCKSWLDNGLQPRAVTRDLDWGVKVPLTNAEGKVLYVWFDAPIGYISATKDWAQQIGKPDEWKKWWKINDSELTTNNEQNTTNYELQTTKLVHFIGKDNIVFHCIIFPSMLKAEGSYILPDNVPANEFMNLENDKISTSRNWAVWLNEYLEDFPGKQDVLRYALTSNAPETKDNDFTWKDFQTKNNSELLAIFGNFINRTLVLTQKYFDNKVPELNSLTDSDMQVIEELKTFPDRIAKSIENYRFREALSEFMNLARLGNKYLTDNEPWKIFNSQPDRVKTILNISLQISTNLAILSEPFLPFTSAKLFRMLNLENGERTTDNAQLKWNNAGSADILKPGHTLRTTDNGQRTTELLFDKIEDDAINAQIQKLQASKEQNQLLTTNYQLQTIKPNISYEDFAKIDIRTATILSAEKVAKTKKLLKLTIDTGIDKRTIVSGIAEFYEPENLIGKNIVMLANLEPKEIKGIKSQGMILMAEDSTGILSLISPIENIQNGSTVK